MYGGDRAGRPSDHQGKGLHVRRYRTVADCGTRGRNLADAADSA